MFILNNLVLFVLPVFITLSTRDLAVKLVNDSKITLTLLNQTLIALCAGVLIAAICGLTVDLFDFAVALYTYSVAGLMLGIILAQIRLQK